MINILMIFFNCLKRLDKFLREPQLWGQNGFILVSGSLIILGVISSQVQAILNSDVMMNFFVFLFGSLIYLVIPYLFYKGEHIKKFILFGKKESVEEIFQKFTTKSYLIFLIFFSYLMIIPVVGIPLMLKIYTVNILEIVQLKLNVIVYSLVVVTSIIWFSYHIVFLTVPLQKIKVKVALYTAFGTTLTIILKSKLFEHFIFIMALLLLSYLWIQYLIELKADQIEVK